MPLDHDEAPGPSTPSAQARVRGPGSASTEVLNRVQAHAPEAKALSWRLAARWGLFRTDLESWALEGLWRASEAYTWHGTPFWVFARRCVTRACIDGARLLSPSKRGRGNDGGVYSPCPWSLVEDLDLYPDEPLGPEDLTQLLERRRQLEARVQELPERECVVVHGRYFMGLKHSELARILGVTEARVSQLLKQGLERLRWVTE